MYWLIFLKMPETSLVTHFSSSVLSFLCVSFVVRPALSMWYLAIATYLRRAILVAKHTFLFCNNSGKI